MPSYSPNQPTVLQKGISAAFKYLSDPNRGKPAVINKPAVSGTNILGLPYGPTKPVAQVAQTNKPAQPVAATVQAPIAAPVPKPVVPPVINAASVSNIETPQIAPPPVSTAQEQLMAGVKSAQEQFKLAQDNLSTKKEITGLQTQESDINTKILSALESLGTKGTTQTTIENQLGMTENTKRLQQLNEQIAQRSSAYDAGMVDIEGKPIPIQFITGQQAQVQRQKAVDIGALTSLTQAVQGNIDLARDTAKQTVDAQFDPIENKIKQYAVQLEDVQSKLTGAEARRAEELGYILETQKQQIADEKEKKNNVMSIMLDAAKNNAPQDVLSRIQNATTVFDAISAGGQYLASTGDWSLTTDKNGDDIAFNKNTGVSKKVTPGQSVNSNSSFTADGITWNIGGWATDETKAKQMQDKANKIGKLTDANLEAKVAEFVPGLSADMIRETSAKTGVSWEALMTMVSQESPKAQSNVAIKNNNFGGLLWSEGTQWADPQYGGVKGTARPASEGGNYTKFPTKQAGLDAMGALMAQYGTVEPQAQDNRQAALGLILGSGKFTKEQKADVTRAINKGEDPLTVVKNQAKNIMGQTLATDLDKYETAREQLSSIESLLSEYYKNGGKTNFLSGNYEKVVNKLGEINDPNLVEIATNIQAALQVYRNAVSGTAYSVQEGKDIASIFPGINKTEGLNKAIINGRMRAFDTTIDAKYANTLGSSYAALKGANTSTPSTQATVVAPVNEVVSRNTLSKAKTSKGETLTPDEVTNLLGQMKLLSSQGKTQEQITAAINYALGY